MSDDHVAVSLSKTRWKRSRKMGAEAVTSLILRQGVESMNRASQSASRCDGLVMLLAAS